MAETYFDLSSDDRSRALAAAAAASNRPVHLLEKDIWVVWCLETLFAAPIGAPLVFKGGTSLSKAHRVIHRFSEDVDLTHDIRQLIPDLVGEAPDALPPSRSQESKWTKEARKRLAAWVEKTAKAFFGAALTKVEPDGEVCVDGAELFIRYVPKTQASDYIRHEVKLEFGARATGEPNRCMSVVCDAAPHVENVVFPEAAPRVMSAERTFWEKATAAHVHCKQERRCAERFARHWYDLTRLAKANHAAGAFADRDLAKAVADHKNMFFREKDRDGKWIDYREAISGGLKLVPEGEARKVLAEDYARMVDEGLFTEIVESFDDVMAACAEIEECEKASASIRRRPT